MQGMIGQMQGGMPQQQPQGPPQQGGGVYPANKDEAAQFVADIMNGLYAENQMPSVAGMLKGAQGGLPEKVGNIAGSLVASVIERRKQENGRQPHINLVILGIDKAVNELSEIAEMTGAGKLSEKDMQMAGEMAAKTIERQGNQPQQQAQAPQPQQAM